MKQNIKHYAILLISFLTLSGCAKEKNQYPSFEESIITKSNGVFADLGNYIVLMDEYKQADYDSALNYFAATHSSAEGACTACATTNENGDVLIGRNLDMEISLYPAYVIPTSFGRYKTLQIRYLSEDLYTYEEFKVEGYKNKDWVNLLPFTCTDALNEKGLYVEANVREANEGFQSSGTNPGKKRASIAMLVGLAAQNCATVEEVVSYLENELDIYSFTYTDYETPTDYAFMVGDATGEYGVIEVAFNQIKYFSHQSAQANFFINPEWKEDDLWGSGYGRYEMAIDGLEDVQTQNDMLKHMEKSMWKDMALYSDCCYIDDNGKPHFVNDKGEEIEDWRSDYYFSMLYEVWPKEEIDRVFGDKNQKWMMDDRNVETVFYYCQNYFVNNGGKQNLLEYYKGNELPLRTSVNAPTTGVQFSVNCQKKNMVMRFFEKESLTYQFGF